MFQYLSYIILIYFVLKFYKINNEYTLLTQTLLISIGIYVINLLIPIKIKENFGINPNGKIGGGDCNTNSNCKYDYCRNNKCTNEGEHNTFCNENSDCISHNCNISTNKCIGLLINGTNGCFDDRNCDSHHCVNMGGSYQCRATRRHDGQNRESCGKNSDCNDYNGTLSFNNNGEFTVTQSYMNDNKCNNQNKCQRR